MTTLENYTLGRWTPGAGEQQELRDASTGEVVALAHPEGSDFAAILAYGRRVGNPALRRMTFHERGRMLKALAFHLTEKKEQFYDLSYRSGATRADSWIDIEGGIGNLFANASLRRKFPDKPFYVEGEPVGLSKGGTFVAQHLLVPKEGVAVHINAYNFPIWGMLEKIAVNLLAGMPAVVKPAVPAAYLTEAVVREIVASGILPAGALQLVVGSGQGILDHVTYQDVVTFTGSAATGRKLRAHPRIIEEAVPFTLEADSLNAAVLGPDARPGTAEFDLFVKEVRREMTAKCGQKCTAIRRAIVPETLLEDVQIALGKALAQTTIGHPLAAGVRMGALVGRAQAEQLRERVRQLAQRTPIVYGSLEPTEILGQERGADAARGAFMSPILLLNEHPFEYLDTHEIEAFGPVATLMPYRDLAEAVALANLGRGSLVCSLATNDAAVAQEFVLGTATHHGRILVLNEEMAKESTGHGSPLPLLVHGGPGRAGGGQEMGRHPRRRALHAARGAAGFAQHDYGHHGRVPDWRPAGGARQAPVSALLRGTGDWADLHHAPPHGYGSRHHQLRPGIGRQFLCPRRRYFAGRHALHGPGGARLLYPEQGRRHVRGPAQGARPAQLRPRRVSLHQARLPRHDHRCDAHGEGENRPGKARARRCGQGHRALAGHRHRRHRRHGGRGNYPDDGQEERTIINGIIPL